MFGRELSSSKSKKSCEGDSAKMISLNDLMTQLIILTLVMFSKPSYFFLDSSRISLDNDPIILLYS